MRGHTSVFYQHPMRNRAEAGFEYWPGNPCQAAFTYPKEMSYTTRYSKICRCFDLFRMRAYQIYAALFRHHGR